MTQEEICLLSILSVKLFHRGQQMPEVTPELQKLADVQAVSLFAAWKPEGIAYNMRLKHAAQELHTILSDAGIPYVILKGSASASYYGSMEMYRSAGDIDFLVSDVSAASKALLAAGFTHPQIPDCDHHRVYEKGGIEYELHWAVNGAPKNNAAVQNCLSDIIDAAEFRNGMMMPDAFHHSMVLLLHMARHMTCGGMGLRQLCDWAVYVNQVDISVWRDRYEKCGLWQFAKIVSAVCAKYLSAKAYHWWADVDAQTLEDVMEEILRSGNFGRRNNVPYVSLFTGDINQNGSAVGKSRISYVASNVCSICCNYFPIMKKWKILLPVGWVIIGSRYVFRVLTGRRELITGRQMRELDRKENLYRELRLFDVN